MKANTKPSLSNSDLELSFSTELYGIKETVIERWKSFDCDQYVCIVRTGAIARFFIVKDQWVFAGLFLPGDMIVKGAPSIAPDEGRAFYKAVLKSNVDLVSHKDFDQIVSESDIVKDKYLASIREATNKLINCHIRNLTDSGTKKFLLSLSDLLKFNSKDEIDIILSRDHAHLISMVSKRQLSRLIVDLTGQKIIKYKRNSLRVYKQALLKAVRELE